MVGHAEIFADVGAARKLGDFWENRFCCLASKKYGKSFTAHQIGRSKSAQVFRYINGWHHLTLPDITLWSAPGEHHEIKHKSPTDRGCYGLEDYRLRALKWFSDESQQLVFYTIHDWALAGGRNVQTNREKDWVTANVAVLWTATLTGVARKATFFSLVGGEKKQVKGWFWPATLWVPLREIWT